MESKTPRTDAALFIALSERHYETKIVTAVDFARQLETELAEALAKLDSKQDIVDQLRLDSEIYCDRLKEARAEIEKLKVWLNENHAMDTMTIRNHARTIEKRDEEIKAKNKLVEQMRGALKACEEKICHGVWSDGNDPEPMHKLLDALEAAERGE